MKNTMIKKNIYFPSSCILCSKLYEILDETEDRFDMNTSLLSDFQLEKEKYIQKIIPPYAKSIDKSQFFDEINLTYLPYSQLLEKHHIFFLRVPLIL